MSKTVYAIKELVMDTNRKAILKEKGSSVSCKFSKGEIVRG